MALTWVRNVRLPAPLPAVGRTRHHVVGLSDQVLLLEGDLTIDEHILAHYAELSEALAFSEGIGITHSEATHTNYSVGLAEAMGLAEDSTAEWRTMPLTTCIDVTASPYNCTHDDSASPSSTVLDNNRVGLQAAIAAAIAAGGAKICIPAGYNIPFSQAPSQTYGLYIHNAGAGVPIVFNGDGSTLRPSRPSGSGDFYGIKIVGTGRVVFHGITFSQYGMYNGTEQQHMVQVGDSATATDDVYFDNCRFVDGVGGDGCRLLGQSTDGGATGGMVTRVQFHACRFENCDRSGISVQRGVRDIKITGCYFSGTGDQDIDFEPTGQGPDQRFHIVGNTFTRTAGTSIAITLTGTAGTEPHQHSVFAYNTLIGGYIEALDLGNVLIHGNTIINERAGGSATANIEFIRYCKDITISENYIVRGASATAGYCVSAGQSAGYFPENVCIKNNTMYQNTAISAVYLDSVIGSEVNDNKIVMTLPVGTTPSTVGNGIVFECGAGSSSGSACGNRITGVSIKPLNGIYVKSDATYTLGKFFIERNKIDNFAQGIKGDGASTQAYLPTIFSNHIVNCTSPLMSVYMVGGNETSCPQFISTNTPEGVITSPVGGVCYRTNGSVYRKTSGTGNTGWVTP